MSEIWSNTDFPYMCLKDVERTLAFRAAIRAAVRDIAEREIAPHAAEVDAHSRFPAEARKALTAAGFHATHIGESYGGEGADAIATCIVIEEVARVDAGSFSFTTKTPPASFLIKKAAKLKSGSKEPGKVSAGNIKRSQLAEIAEMKMKDLNANDIEAATRIIEGSARAMGLQVVEG